MKECDMINMGSLLSEKNILGSDLGVSSRQITYWKDRKIFPFLTKEKKGMMNVPEALWMLIINELSTVGIDSKKLTQLSYEIWVKPYYDKYADKVFRNELTLNENLSKENKEWLNHYLENDFIMDSIFRKEINPYTDAIKTCLKNKGNVVSFLYCPKKDVHCFNFNNLQLTSSMNNLFYGETIISIPIFPLLAKVIGLDIKSSNNDLDYLTSLENQIRRIVHFDKPKLLEIVLEGKSSPKLYKITEAHKKPEELAGFFLNSKIPLGAKILIEPRAQGNFKVTIKS